MGTLNNMILNKIKYLNRPLNNFKNTVSRLTFSSSNNADHSFSPDGTTVKLIHFKTLTAYPFSYPFGQKKKVFDALQLKFRPMTGAQETALSFVPQIINSEKKKTEGVAWLLSKSEVDELEKKYGDKCSFWPAPLAFVPSEDGVRVVICDGDDESSAIFFSDKKPLVYCWAGKEDGGAAYLTDWMEQYAASIGATTDSIDNYDLKNMSTRDITAKGMASVELLEGLNDFDISNVGANTAQAMQDFIGRAQGLLKAFAFSGAIAFLLSSILFFAVLGKRALFSESPRQIFKTVFAEDSQSPLSSVNRKLRVLTGSSSRLTFEQTLSNFITAWKNEPSTKDIKLDSMRYGTDMTEIQGLAGNMKSIQQLQTSLNNNGFAAKIGEIQQVQSTGIRFSIVLTEAR